MSELVPDQPRAHGRLPNHSIGRLLIMVGLLALVLQLAVVGGRWWLGRVPDYEVGEMVPRTITTPVAFRTLDPAATEQLRLEEGRRVAPLFRFDGSVADRQVAAFEAVYDAVRDQVRKNHERLEAPDSGDADAESKRFADLVAAFRLVRPEFPLTVELARTWVGDDHGSALRNETAAAIRAVLRGYVVAGGDGEPPNDGHNEVWLSVPVEHGGVSEVGELERQARRVRWRSLVPVDSASAELNNLLPTHGAEWMRFAARFVAPNVTRDEQFTTAARAEAVKDVRVWADYAAGQSVVEQGMVITPLENAALQEYRRLLGGIESEHSWLGWLPSALAVVCLATGLVLRRRAEGAPGGIMAPALSRDEIRTGVVNHLAAWLKSLFVQRLIQQRNDAVAGQASASGHVEELQARLGRLNPEIRERIADYERRIASLERELKDAGEVNRELIRTRILMARKELEIERARSNLVWN